MENAANERGDANDHAVVDSVVRVGLVRSESAPTRADLTSAASTII
jgi:hypothetical protein